MSRADYKKTFKYAWVIQCMHLLGLLQVVSIVLRHKYGIRYSDFYQSILTYGETKENSVIGKELKSIDDLIEGVFKGSSYGQSVDQFEKIVWPAEEASFLRITENLDDFYKEVKEVIVKSFSKEIEDMTVLEDLLHYQQSRLVSFDNQDPKLLKFSHNIHRYFEESRAGVVSNLEKETEILNLLPAKKYDDKKTYSREVVWYGRKGGKFFHPIEEVVLQ